MTTKALNFGDLRRVLPNDVRISLLGGEEIGMVRLTTTLNNVGALAFLFNYGQQGKSLKRIVEFPSGMQFGIANEGAISLTGFLIYINRLEANEVIGGWREQTQVSFTCELSAFVGNPEFQDYCTGLKIALADPDAGNELVEGKSLAFWDGFLNGRERARRKMQPREQD